MNSRRSAPVPNASTDDVAPCCQIFLIWYASVFPAVASYLTVIFYSLFVRLLNVLHVFFHVAGIDFYLLRHYADFSIYATRHWSVHSIPHSSRCYLILSFNFPFWMQDAASELSSGLLICDCGLTCMETITMLTVRFDL